MSSSTKLGPTRIPLPFASWPPQFRRGAFILLLLLTVLNSATLMYYGAPLRTDAAPQGIISFELARTPEVANSILESWSESVREAALTNILLDYPFLCLYSALLMLGGAMAAGTWGRVWPGIQGRLAWIAWVQPLAGALDAIENGAMAWMVHSGEALAPWPLVAWATAVPKFAIVLVGILLTLSGPLAWMLKRR